MNTYEDDIKGNHTELENSDTGSGGLDEDISSEEITLSIGEQKIKVKKNHTGISGVMKVAIGNDQDTNEIPLEGLRIMLRQKDEKIDSFKILKYIVEYMNIHKGVSDETKDIPEKPLKSADISQAVSKEDADFINQFDDKKSELYALIEAANYFDIKGLLHLGCAKVATFIKGKSLENIKKILDPYGDSEKNDQSEKGDVKS